MCGHFLAILRLSTPSPPGRPAMGGIFTPWTKFDWGGTDGGGLNSSGGGFFGDASGSRGSPPIRDNPVSPEIKNVLIFFLKKKIRKKQDFHEKVDQI